MAGRPRKSEQEPRRIYNRVKVARAELGISRVELAAHVGVNPQTIGALERGDHYPSLQLAMNICEVFGAPVEAIFSRSPFRSIGADYQQPTSPIATEDIDS